MTSFAQDSWVTENPVRRVAFECADVPLHLTRKIESRPFVPSDSMALNERCEEILDIQAAGLAKRVAHTKAQSAVLGISGGLDSTLALLVAVRVFDKLGLSRSKVIGVTMPGFGTTGRTYRNAVTLVEESGATLREISIAEACRRYRGFAVSAGNPGMADVINSNGRIRGVKLEQNRGKRHAIQYGTKLSTKDVIITVDSDSVVEPDSIRRLNSPFIDPAVGAVAGSVKVSNLSDGVLPRMMDAHYAFSCCVLRAANSVLRTVVCTPGALSAYRRSALLEFLDAWANQTFCGRPAGIGEDRALTTFMLRNRWHVLYQRGAVVHTEMPSKYQATYRMMLRWERGNIREMLSTYEFAFRRFDWFHLAIQLNLIFQTYIFIQSLLFVPFVTAAMVAAPVFWFQSTFLLTILWTALPALCYYLMSGGTGWIWTFTYTFFRTFFLFWISPYSLLTVRNSGWLTRGKAEEAKRAAKERFQQLSGPAAIFGKEVAGQQAPAAHVYFK